MGDKEIALIFKGMSHILANQEAIMRQLGEENFYKVEDTNKLSVQFGKLAKAYFEDNTPAAWEMYETVLTNLIK